MSLHFTDLEKTVLESIAEAYDRYATSGRVFWRDTPEYDAASSLVDQGFLYELTSGVHANRGWAHFELTTVGIAEFDRL